MFELRKNYDISRKLAAQGMVLLKNERNTLPLQSKDKVGIVGKECLDLIKGGGGSADVRCEYVRSLVDGLKEKSRLGKLNFIENTVQIYSKIFKNPSGFTFLFAGDGMWHCNCRCFVR